MHSGWLAAFLVSAFLAVAVGRCQEPDGIEFAELSEASAYGWEVTEDTTLSISTDAKLGHSALRAQPAPGAKPYRGINLCRSLDLTGAGPADALVFYVKQNFGGGMRLQIWTEKGELNRSFALQLGEWTRVALDLDMSHWENPRNTTWGKVVRLAFYESSFMAPEHYLILDGLALTVGGESRLSEDPVRSLPGWAFPCQTAAAWYLGNADVAWAVSKSSGQVLGGWNVRTRERYLNSLEGRYHLEDNHSLVTGRESADTILKATFSERKQRLELSCTNPAVPDLTIRKQYWLEGNKLFQRAAFVTAATQLQFITYNTQAAFTPTYRNGGYYMGGADGGGPLVPAPQISEWQKVVQYQNTAKGMLLHQPDKGYSFAHLRTQLDDQFVWPYFTGAIASYVEPVNMLHYTPDGWDMSLGTSRLSTREETSYTQYVSIFAGDWQTFLRSEYPALPEVRRALREIPPAPEWVGDIKIAAGADLPRLRQMVQMTDEGTIMVLLCLSGSWADYYVDRGIDGGFGGHITGPELREHIQRIKALSPRVKVGIYMWTLSTTDNSRIYRAHPEWFRYGNKDGEPLSTFPGFWPNFAQLLSIPACYDEILAQFELVLGYLGTDFIYLDDPKAINMIEWTSGEYTRDDLSFKFFRDIKRIAAKHGSDKMVFFNNQCNPYGDINYIEARDQLRPNFWRHFAGIAAVDQEFLSATRPQSRIVPLYFIPPTRREYMNKVLALGWIPDLTYCDVVASRAFFQAAYEVGNCAPVPARYSPDWKRDKQTSVESYTVQRRGDTGYLLSFINHAEKEETVPLRLDLASLDLDRAGQVFVWDYVVENALEYEGVATESLARRAYAQTGWQLDRVTRRRLCYAGPYRQELQFELSTAPLILHQLYVTGNPVAVYSEDSLPANYLFNQMPKVTLNPRVDWQKGTLDLRIDCRREQAEVIAFLPLATQRLERVLLDGAPLSADVVAEGDDAFPVLKVTRGRHRCQLTFAAAAPAPARASVAGFRVTATPSGAAVALPGHERALLAVTRNQRLLFNRMVAGTAGNLVLPLSPVRPEAGEYTVSVRAVADAQGRLLPVDGDLRAALTLAAAKPDLGLGPAALPLGPGEREIRAVQQTLRGVEILSAARLTTPAMPNEMQPGLPLLTTRADPEALRLEAGTTRAILQGQDGMLGAAFAGFEIRNLRRVQVKLSNTFHNAFHMRGPGFHVPETPNSRNFAGIVVDYHTPAGYTKRLSLAVGVLHRECSSTYPDYGRAALADASRDLGSALIEVPEKSFALDLQPDAPADWDGQVWLSVGSDWVCPSRTLTLEILAANDAVTGEFLSGTDPKAFRAAYDTPRRIQVPRSPGGIIIDGLPFEEWWGGAAKTDQFFLLGGEGVSSAKTSAKLLYDEVNLYVAFVCGEPDRRKPLTVGGPPWDDDEVEVWIDAKGDGTSFRQVILNGANEKLEYGEAGPTPIGATAAVHVVEGEAWMVEMTIPFKGLGVPPPRPGDSWRLSLCRGRPPGKKNPNHELIVWAPLKAGFKDLPNFGTLTFR